MSIKKVAVKKTAKKSLKKGLGRGLEGLLGEDIEFSKSLNNKEGKENSINTLSINDLRPGKYQPRTRMSGEELEELASSIRNEGIMQPLLVRPVSEGTDNQYEIIAGERRFKAAIIAGLKEVPVLIRQVDDQKAAILALIENMQREDLNPLEEARGLKRLINEFQYTHEQAAEAVGRSRSFTTNLLRLLNLAEPVQNQLLNNEINMGHARALLSLDSAEQIIVANQIIAKQLSVRETERLVKKILEPNNKEKAVVKTKDRDLERLEESLSDHLGTQVLIKVNKKQQGQLVMSFHNWEQLNELLTKQGLDRFIEN